jgi:hypothetical protein
MHAEHVADDLRERGLVTLPVRARARPQDDPSFGLDREHGGLAERRRPGRRAAADALHVHRDAHPAGDAGVR